MFDNVAADCKQKTRRGGATAADFVHMAPFPDVLGDLQNAVGEVVKLRVKALYRSWGERGELGAINA
jgi:hypothetical protein